MFKFHRYISCTKFISRVSSAQYTFVIKRNVNFLVDQERNVEELQDEILDALHPVKAPVFSKVPDFIKNRSESKTKSFKHGKTKDAIIVCKNSKLNHFKNQKYDNPENVPLASKGWLQPKAKGDYFKIKVCDDEEYIKNLFWDKEKTDFNNFRINPSLIEALKEFGFTQPTKIQAKSISSLLSGKNSLITAETGCGKTLAYLIPVINQILEWTKQLPADRDLNKPLALILVPSRDLANQIGNVAVRLSYMLPFRCNILVGGRTKKKMLNPQFEQIDLQVATPGALSKLVTTGLYDLSGVKHVVLDEGDTMLDDSFSDVLLRILRKIKIRCAPSAARGQIPDNSQITIVSATMPRNIYQILDSVVEMNSLHDISTERTHQILPHVSQTFYRLGSTQKPKLLLQLVAESLKNNEKLMIFSNQTKTCDWISMMLGENGFNSIQLNGGMPEIMRRNKFKEFLDGEAQILSCTDIASRGLDTTQVRHIINYEFPKFMADYVHRCGRTGRVGSHSKCHISNFISTDSDVKLVQKIETATRCMNALPNVNGNISKIIQDRFDRLEGLI